MRAPRLITAVLTASLTLTAAAAADAQDTPPDGARIRLTGELLKTSSERAGDRQWFALRVGGRLVPVTGAGLGSTPDGATVTADVAAPQRVVRAAAADRNITTTPAKGVAPVTHRLRRSQLRAAASRPAAATSTLGAASTAVALEPGAEPLEVTHVLETQAAATAGYTPATRRITYVEVTPQGVTRQATSATAAAAQVAATDAYWSDQSAAGLRVGAPTVKTAYRSAYPCGDDPYKLWDEAMARTGWQWRDNASLVIKLPAAASASCGYGLGTLGATPNSPGILHVSDIAAPVLAHELGHNMSLDHANSLVCGTRTDTSVNTSTQRWYACDEVPYGDSLDIMGPSSRTDFPMLSTPQALRTGLLPPSAATRVGVGHTRLTLKPLSGLGGVRAAVTTDKITGVTYWVEYRTPTGRDASNPYGQDTGVRILRTAPWSGSVVLDTTPTGVLDDHVSLAPGRTFSSYDGRIKIATESTSSTEAVVRLYNTDQLWSFRSVAPPKVTGTPRVGSRLTATKGTWSPTPTTYVYRWMRNGVDITGATRSTYTPTTADAGRRISVRVGARRLGYRAQSATSASVGVPIHPTTRPTLSGTRRSGSTMSVKVGAWTPKPTSYRYQWYRNNIALSGRTARTYTLTTRDKGQRIHVRMTAHRTGYVTGAATTPGYTIAR